MANLEYRSFNVESNTIDKEKRTVHVIFSTETPYQRAQGLEILSHEDGAMDLSFFKSGNSPLLLDHDPKQLIGIIEDARIEDKKGKAVVRFSENMLGQEVFKDVVTGIRKTLSFGYKVNKIEKREDDDSYLVTDYTPREISFTSIPADPNAVVGRNEEQIKNNNIIEEKTTMDIKKQEEVSETKSETVDVDAVRAEAMEAERTRIAEINTIATKMGVDATEFVKSGKSVEDFRAYVIENWEQKKEETRVSTSAAPAIHTKDHEYSVSRALFAASDNNWDEAGYEREMNQEMARKAGKAFTGRSFFIDPNQVETRAMSVGGTDQGEHMVGTQHRPDRFIDLLYSETVADKLGVDHMLGLVGNQSIPGWATGSTATWGGETDSATESTPTDRKVELSPKRLDAKVKFSRQLQIQSQPQAEERIKRDIRRVIALAVDTALINGTGANTPTGVLNLAGVGSVALGTDGGDPTYASILQLIKEVKVDNALLSNRAFLGNANTTFKMQTTLKDANTAAVYLQGENSDTLAGRKYVESEIVPSDLTKGSGTNLSPLVFGAWSQAMIANWNMIEIETDPYTAADTGEIVCRSFSWWDIGYNHPESFAVISDMITV